MVNWYGSILVLHLEYMVPLDWLNHAPLYLPFRITHGDQIILCLLHLVHKGTQGYAITYQSH